MKCSKCAEEAKIKQGNQWLCDKHYRFGQMRQSARRRGKLVPTHEQLEGMASTEMKCPDCDVVMNWRAIDGQSTVASLQHYRSGRLAIVCRTCNTRHAHMVGDSYCDMPKDHKMCPSCKETKPLTRFSADNGRSGIAKRKSCCKECSDAKVNEWRKNNREKYNAYQRARRAESAD